MISLDRFELDAPLAAGDLEGVLAQAGFEVGSGIRELYEHCAGGYDEELDLRILPPGEALDFAGFFREAFPSMNYWPFLVYGPEGSDPYSLCCAGPLCGYVICVAHDDVTRVKAGSLEGFMARLSQVDDEDWCPSDEARFDSPGSGELAAALEQLDLAESRVDSDEAGHLFEVGLDLVADADVESVIHLLDHPRHDLRRKVRDRWCQVPAAYSAMAAFDAKFRAFVERAAEVLREQGLDATASGDSIRVEPGPVHLNMPMFYDRKDDSEVWDFLIERTRYLLSLKS